MDGEAAGWLELAHLGDLADVGYGALVHVECEVYVPDIVRMLASEGGASDALGLMQDLLPMATSLGLDVDDTPDREQLTAMQQVLSRISSDLVVVGEDDESDWKIAGRLVSDHLVDSSIDGYVRVVGKVSQRWPEGRWKPLLALPGASLIPRKERRALEAKKPSEDDEDQYLPGPAVMLDLLALYR